MNRRDKTVLELTEQASGEQVSREFSGEGARGIRLFQTFSHFEGTQARLNTNLAGNHNDLTFIAVAGGDAGENITIAYVDPSGNDQPLGIVVTDLAIVVNLATDSGGSITSTAQEIMDAVNEDEDASALVTASLKVTNDGTGVVIAMSPTNLTSGNQGNVVTVIEVKNPVTGDWMTLATATAVTMDSTTMKTLTLYPGIAVNTGSEPETLNGVLSGSFRIKVTLTSCYKVSMKVVAQLID